MPWPLSSKQKTAQAEETPEQRQTREKFELERINKQSQMAALATFTNDKYVVAVITIRLPGGRRKAVQIVSVDISGKRKKAGTKNLWGGEMIVPMNRTSVSGSTDSLTFSVGGNTYELDPEYIEYELPRPTIFYTQGRGEAIHFFEREIDYNGRKTTSAELIGHYSLKLDQVMNQKIIDIAAERDRRNRSNLSVGSLSL